MSTYYDEFGFTPKKEAHQETVDINPQEDFSGQDGKFSHFDRTADRDLTPDVADWEDYLADTPITEPISRAEMVKIPFGIVDFNAMLDSTAPPDDLLTPKYLTMSDDDPKKALNQGELKHIFSKMLKSENVCGASLRKGKTSLNSRLYPIGTGLVILSVEDRLHFTKIDLDTAFPFEFVCGNSSRLNLPVLVSRFNNDNYNIGNFFPTF